MHILGTICIAFLALVVLVFVVFIALDMQGGPTFADAIQGIQDAIHALTSSSSNESIQDPIEEAGAAAEDTLEANADELSSSTQAMTGQKTIDGNISSTRLYMVAIAGQFYCYIKLTLDFHQELDAHEISKTLERERQCTPNDFRVAFIELLKDLIRKLKSESQDPVAALNELIRIIPKLKNLFELWVWM